jgi:hypothetical protein
MKKSLPFLLLLPISLYAQNEALQPFESLGKTVKVLTLSNGKYNESFPNDSIMRIGSVLYNRNMGELVSVIPPDTLQPRTDVASRWLSIDPLAHKFAAWSPYNFVMNNPVFFIDPDGRDVKPSEAFMASKYGIVYSNMTKNKNSTLNRINDVFTSNERKKQYHYILDYIDYLDPSKNKNSKPTLGYAIGKTRNIPGLDFMELDGSPTGGSITTFFIPTNETTKDGSVLNDVGRAITIIHEAVHANIMSTSTQSMGLNSDHHNDYTDVMQTTVLASLKEFNKSNKLGMTAEQMETASWAGLQGSQLFNDRFGISDLKSDVDKEKRFKEVQSQINSTIFNNPNDTKDANKFNLKN